MRIYNKTKTTAYFRYAGRGIRGVDLKPGQESPELPTSRLLADFRVQKDLRLNNIGVMVTPAEVVALKGGIPDDLLAKCTVLAAPAADTATESSKGNEDAQPATTPFSSAPIPVPVVPEPPPEVKPVVFEKKVTPTVDPVKEEVARKVAMTAEADRQAELDRLKASASPAVAKAAEAVQKAQPQPPAKDESWTGAADDTEDAPQPGKPVLDTSKYRGLAKAVLFSECMKRGINDVHPGTKTKDLRRRLAENDLKQPKVG